MKYHSQRTRSGINYLLVRIGDETEEMREHSGVENGLNSGFKPAGETTERRCRLYEDAVVVVVVAFCIGEIGRAHV